MASDSNTKPKDRKNADFTKAGRNSRSGGKRAKRTDLLPPSISNVPKPASLGAMQNAAARAASEKQRREQVQARALRMIEKQIANRIPECTDHYGRFVGTIAQAKHYMQFLFDGNVTHLATGVPSPEVQDATRFLFTLACTRGGVNDAHSQKAAWYAPMQASAEIQAGLKFLTEIQFAV